MQGDLAGLQRRQLDAHRHSLQLGEVGLGGRGGGVAEVEIALQPFAADPHVLAEGVAVAGQQRQAGVHEAQLEVFAQEHRVARRQQRRVGAVHALDAQELAELGPEIRPQALEPRWRGLVGLDAGGAGLGLEGQRQAVEPADEGFELEGDAGRINLGQRLEGVEVGGNGLAQGQPLGPVDRAEAGVGGLQREQRGVHVAGELELLGGDGDGLFDLGQHPVVPAAGELLVHGLEGDLLALGFGQLGVEGADLALEVLEVFLGLPGEGAGLFGGGVTVGEAAGQVFLEVGQAAAGLDPLPAQQGQRHGGDDDGRTTPGRRARLHRAGGLDGREAGDIAHEQEFNPDRRWACQRRSGRRGPR